MNKSQILKTLMEATKHLTLKKKVPGIDFDSGKKITVMPATFTIIGEDDERKGHTLVSDDKTGRLISIAAKDMI
jgi:hypothetical protein